MATDRDKDNDLPTPTSFDPNAESNFVRAKDCVEKTIRVTMHGEITATAMSKMCTDIATLLNAAISNIARGRAEECHRAHGMVHPTAQKLVAAAATLEQAALELDQANTPRLSVPGQIPMPARGRA